MTKLSKFESFCLTLPVNVISNLASPLYCQFATHRAHCSAPNSGDKNTNSSVSISSLPIVYRRREHRNSSLSLSLERIRRLPHSNLIPTDSYQCRFLCIQIGEGTRWGTTSTFITRLGNECRLTGAWSIIERVLTIAESGVALYFHKYIIGKVLHVK